MFMIDQLIRMDEKPRHGINSSTPPLEDLNPDTILPRARIPSIEIDTPMKQEIDTDFPDSMIESDSHSCILLQSNPSHSPSSNPENLGKNPDDNRCLRDNTGAENLVPFYPFLPSTDLALAGIECRLVTRDLWCRFNKLGTEMIITKSGRLLEIDDRLVLKNLVYKIFICFLFSFLSTKNAN